MKLKRDVFSVVDSKRKYGGAGDEVKIITSPLIVEGPDGERFSITSDDILQEGEQIIKEDRVINERPVKKQKSVIKSINNPQLF